MRNDLIQQLHRGKYSLVIANHDEIRTFSGRGVSDLYDLLSDDPLFLRGASVADKVVGKGAAALMIIGGIAELYTDVISDSAWELLHTTATEVSFGQQVPQIWNRTHTDRCPVEKLCEEARTAEECLPIIDNFIKKLRS